MTSESVRAHRWLLLAPLFLIVAAASWWRAFTERKTANGPGVVDVFVPRAALDVGDVWSQRDFSWVLPIHNRSMHSVHISDITASCNCTSVQPTALVIPPSETKPVKLALDLASRSTAESVSTRFPFSFDIIVRVDRPAVTSLHFKLAGSVRNAICLSQPTVYFDEESNVRGGNRTFIPKTIQYEAAVPLKSVELLVPTSDVWWSVNMDTDRSGTICVQPQGGFGPGPFRKDAEVLAVAIDGDHLPPTPLAIQGVVVEDVYCLPEQVVLGPIDVGQEAEAIVSLQSRTGKRFSIDSVSIMPDANALSVERLALTEVAYRIRQRISTEGVNISHVIFHARAGELSSDVSLPVRYIGLRMR